MHAIAGKVVGFGEALKPEFKLYIKSVIKNAKILSEVLLQRGLNIVSGGTDTHVVLVDLRPKSLTGNIVEDALERAGITCNKNGIPFDPEKLVNHFNFILELGVYSFKNSSFVLTK